MRCIYCYICMYAYLYIYIYMYVYIYCTYRGLSTHISNQESENPLELLRAQALYLRECE